MLKYHRKVEVIIGELIDDDLMISQVQDFLDLIGDLGTENCFRDFVRESNSGNRVFFLNNIDDALRKLEIKS